MITCLLVDDEQNCIVSLKQLLGMYHPDVKILGEVHSVQEAYDWLLTSKLHPDMVFLDIQMPEEDAFALLRKFPQINFSIVFTTAYDAYAIKAIKFSALDYLLKPIDKQELQMAINKYKQQKQLTSNDHRLQEFRQNMLSEKAFSKLGIPTLSAVSFVELEEILYFESDSNYTHIYILNNKHPLISSRNIGYYEELLQSSHFFRVHNSYLINLKHVSRYLRSKSGTIELSNGKQVEISKRRKEQFMKLIGG